MKLPFSHVFAAYVIAGFATFGWYYNTTPPNNRCYVDNGKQHDCFETTDRPVGAVVSGALWPVYWAGTLAIKWVHP